MPFLLAEILNFQCALHLKGVGSLSYILKNAEKLSDDLYIPIWFYSNQKQYRMVVCLRWHFTFQSGSILMSCPVWKFMPYSRFTFQSGSILMPKGDRLQVKINSFTFQSGSILITTSTDCPLGNDGFTFQSGSILIREVWLWVFVL